MLFLPCSYEAADWFLHLSLVEPLVRDLYSGLAVKFGVGSKGVVSPQHQVSTSALEHHSTVSMQQGYDNLFEDIIMYHG